MKSRMLSPAKAVELQFSAAPNSMANDGLAISRRVDFSINHTGFISV